MNNKKNIKDRFAPYNFSATKCFIVTVLVTPSRVAKIESKLPKQALNIKGIYATTNAFAEETLIGKMNLWFNEGIFKSVSIPVLNTRLIRHHSQPILLNEGMKPNGTMQGIYYNLSTPLIFPYLVKIYIHYEESL